MKEVSQGHWHAVVGLITWTMLQTKVCYTLFSNKNGWNDNEGRSRSLAMAQI